MAAAFEWHNYGKSTIGNRSDIERVPIERLQAFYKKYYQPDNAVLIVAGKFDEAKALELIGKTLRRDPEADARSSPTTYTEEPPQDGERSVTLRRVGDVQARRGRAITSRRAASRLRRRRGARPSARRRAVGPALQGARRDQEGGQRLRAGAFAARPGHARSLGAEVRQGRIARRRRGARCSRCSTTSPRTPLTDGGGRARAREAAEEHRADAQRLRARRPRA